VYPSQRALCEAIGKGSTPHYVSRRLKLLDAPDFLLDAIRAGTPVMIGVMIGSMSSMKDREEMARLALKHPELGIPMTPDQVEEYIRTRFCRPLSKCGFDLADAELLTDADKKRFGFHGAVGEEGDGSCERCPARSGNASDFVAGESGENSAWMCEIRAASKRSRRRSGR